MGSSNVRARSLHGTYIESVNDALGRVARRMAQTKRVEPLPESLERAFSELEAVESCHPSARALHYGAIIHPADRGNGRRAQDEVIKKLKPAGSLGIMYGMALRYLFLSLLTIVALSSCAGQSRQEDDRILVTAVDVDKGQLTLTFERTGQVRVYYVNGLTFIANPHGPTRLREIHVGQKVFSYHESNRYTLDSLIVGYSDPIDSL